LGLDSQEWFNKTKVPPQIMDERIFSDDGNFLWNGSQWIPYPLNNEEKLNNDVEDLSDLMNDIESLLESNNPGAESNSSSESNDKKRLTELKISDSVVMGDINIGASVSDISENTKLLIENQSLRDKVEKNRGVAYMNHIERSLMTDSHRQRKIEKEKQKHLERIIYGFFFFLMVLVFIFIF
jgi:Fe2+ transport system protein B